MSTGKPERVYVASRASVPERPAMWRNLRDSGYIIVSSWIDEAGAGETVSFADLWSRVVREITSATRLVLYAEAGDFPLKGALVEVGVALGTGVPVYVVAPDVPISPDFRPLGSWLAHPLVTIEPNLLHAMGLLPPLADPIANCPLVTGLRPCMCDLPRCPTCNYSDHDARFEMDHGSCSGVIPAPRPPGPPAPPNPYKNGYPKPVA